MSPSGRTRAVCFAGLIGVLAACSAPSRSVPTASPTTRPATQPTTETPGPTGVGVEQARPVVHSQVFHPVLYAEDLGVVAVERCRYVGHHLKQCNSKLLESRDFGQSWDDITPPGMHPFLFFGDVFVLDAQRLWTVITDSEHGRLVSSADGGRTWTRLAHVWGPGVHAGDELGLAFLDPLAGWLSVVSWAGEAASTEPTIDRGASWLQGKRLPSVALPSFGSQAFGVLGGTESGGPLLYVTNDGADSWRPVHLQHPPSLRFQWDWLRNPDDRAFEGLDAVAAISVIRSGNGAAGRAFYSSSDGGASWELAGTFVPGAQVAVSIATADEWWACWGKPGRCRVTADGGASWSVAHPLPLDGYVEALDGRQAWVVDDAGHLFVTRDGGRHWVRRPRIAPPR